jgi:hypothetical protein
LRFRDPWFPAVRFGFEPVGSGQFLGKFWEQAGTEEGAILEIFINERTR